jgi:hypothetical protein
VSFTSALSCADVVLIPSLADDISLNGVGLFFSEPIRELRSVIWPSPEDELFANSPVFGLVGNRVAGRHLVPEAVEKFRDFASTLDGQNRDLQIVASTTAISQAVSFGKAAESTQSNKRVFALDEARQATKEQIKSLANDVEGWAHQTIPPTSLQPPFPRRRSPSPVDASR